MYTWKSIPSSDYSIRTFKTYKNWSFVSGSDVLILSASNTLIYRDSNTTEYSNNFSSNPHSLYGQIKSSFYTFSDFQIVSGIRELGNKAKVFSIPIEYIGEGIKFGSVSITDTPSGQTFVDNTSGSLMSSSIVVGDIFYDKGIVVYTDTNSMDNFFNNSWQLNFKSTQTITEHEIFVGVEKNEFNISRNPTALKTENQVWYKLEGSKINNTKLLPPSPSQSILIDQGTQYVRKRTESATGNIIDYRYGSKITAGVSGGFEHYDVSASVDSTGSYLTPYVTTIGLYDDTNTLMAIAKLPTPIKMEPILPINFIIRFDV